MDDKKYRHIDIHRALKVILGINYRFHWLDVSISPLEIIWSCAVQFRNDPKRRWNPRIVIFYPQSQVVAVYDGLNTNPAVVQASTIIAMAETRAQSPTPPTDGA